MFVRIVLIVSSIVLAILIVLILLVIFHKKKAEEEITILDGEGTVVLNVNGKVTEIEEMKEKRILTISLVPESEEVFGDSLFKTILYDDIELNVGDMVSVSFVERHYEGEPKMIGDATIERIREEK